MAISVSGKFDTSPLPNPILVGMVKSSRVACHSLIMLVRLDRELLVISEMINQRSLRQGADSLVPA